MIKKEIGWLMGGGEMKVMIGRVKGRVNLLMVLSFIFFWTPYALTSIVSVFKSDLSAFWKVSDGTYDKEGVYVGKVQVGLCTCNGCAMSRREVRSCGSQGKVI
ncbi:hypothetical protein Pcinc_030162 [Petrolisthes cinctipes]|uniref:Uncharacterized protein n=1 Tax=Petrolisthes cinctipes TaxID=88211 RepID=A0AAE1K6D7_PETCI|nr:hypothetical protein Pcinc_030162 [Petrolisthes cinctipes]